MRRRAFLGSAGRAALGIGLGGAALAAPRRLYGAIVYTVRKGDTLSEIATRHGISVNSLKRHNALKGDLIRAGQHLVIPEAVERSRLHDVIRETQRIRVKSTRWKYIVAHHSGIDDGNAAAYDRYHRDHMHMQNGLAYHFVIGNGRDSGDGQIEIGGRWRRQLHGGHVRNNWVNQVGIGICLVGNFERHDPTRRQMEALVQLIDWLRADVIRIPNKFSVHKEIDRNHTVCPGRHFPVADMHRRFPSV